MEKKKEDELIRAAQAGEADALIELITPYQQRTYNLVFQVIRNHSDTEDIVQEAFIRVFEAIGKFKGESSFFTWLYRVVVNTCRDHLRRKARRKEISLEDPLINRQMRRDDSVPRPDEEAEARERGRLIAAALDSLPFVHKMVVILHDFDGLSHREIARIMNCSQGTVWSRLYYAREKLRRRLEKYFRDEE